MSNFKFFKKNVLIISPEEWDHIKVSKHHYAEILASKGNVVFFLNPPDKNVNGVECKNVAHNLFVIDYRDPYKGIRFFPKKIRKYLTKKLYNKFQVITQTKFDVVVIFENSRFYDLDFLPKNVLSIYFQVDENQTFYPERAAKTASLVIAINNVIKDILEKYRMPVFRIPHGFSGEFSENALSLYKGEKVYKKQAGPVKAYYVGYLDNYYVDTDLFVALVLQTPEVEFFFVGPYSTKGKLYTSIKDCKNVSFLGKMPGGKIPELLDKADILFFAYTDDFLSSSHKVMEYLASGKAIVTTRAIGYPEDADLFFCSSTREDFVDLFSRVCENIEEVNSPDKMKKRIQFAMDNTYESRLGQIEELIDRNCNG